jgi:rare lipoprotein A
LTYIGIAALVAGCGGTPERDTYPLRDIDVSKIPDAVPKVEPVSAFGNPDYYDVFGQRYYPLKSSLGFAERGVASWYGPTFHGKRASSGETYDMYQMTAAHRTLPLPTYVEVVNLENNRRVVLKVNDRGPFVDNRVIDLSYVAALKLGVVGRGTAPVEVRAIDPRGPMLAARPSSKSVMPAKKAEKQAMSFYLQVGAFEDMGKARQISHEIREAVQETVRIHQAQGIPKPLYRVQVGPFVNVEVADRVVQELSKLGFNNHHVVVN